MTLRVLLTVVLVGCALRAENAKPLPARDRALAAWKAGNTTNAITIISEALATDGKDPRLWNFRAQMRSQMGDLTGAEADLSEAIRVAPGSAVLHEERGMARFKLGQMSGAVADFDQANEFDPKFAPHNWQRGLALYYLDRFADAKRQFELHRTVNSNDVENSVWHFLCVAKAENLDAARQQFLDIASDDRIPMVEIHELYAGKGDIEDVLEAARDAAPVGREQRQAQFYAQLYLGLYCDVQGQREKAIEYLRQAVALALPDDYMGHVARIHLQRLTAPSAPAAKP
jgi:lipoprotein NlpI